MTCQRIECMGIEKALKEKLTQVETELTNTKILFDNCKASNAVIDKLLAASQAREQVLREGIRTIAATWISADRYDRLFFEGLLAPSDDTALRQWGAKLLREAADELDNHGEYSSACQLRRIAKELEDEK